MLNTESIKTMDVELCKKFLRWAEQTPDKARMSNYETMLEAATSIPLDTLMSGLKATAEKLEQADANPVMRIMTNPVGIFQTGLLLGFCMSMASVHPEFAQMLEALENRTKNVTPITAAKGFK